jgi:prophage regulatory protein
VPALHLPRAATPAVLARKWMMQTILRLPAVKARVGLSRSSIYARIAAGSFPAPIQLGEGARARGWVAEEIDSWLTRQVERSRKSA